MLIATGQDPLRVDPAPTKYCILMAIDRGNSGCKIAVSINGIPMSAFKIPSVIRKVDTDGVIKIGNSSYVCGDAAISMTSGSVSTPLRSGDKVKDLNVVIAQAIQKITETQSLDGDIELSLVVSSPFPSDALVAQVKSEVLCLENGFFVDGRSYKLSLGSIESEFEGAVLLKSDREFNGVVDIGFGTILAAYRGVSGKVAIAPLMGGDMGGCNLVLNSLLNDPTFLTKVKASGASAPPSVERLSARLSEGLTKLRDIDLKPLLKGHLKVLKQRIEDAIKSVETEIRLSSEDAPKAKIALIGGGAKLLQLSLSPEALTKWCADHSVEIFESPDYQTAMAMHQNAHVRRGL